MVTALIIVLIVVAIRRTKISFSQIPLKFLLLYAFAFSTSGLFFTVSTLTSKISTTVFLLYLGSFTTTLILGRILYKEHFTFMKILSLSLALIGLTFFTYPFTIAKLSWGLAFGLLAGLGDGLANTASKYVGGKADDFALVVLRVSGGIVIGLSALIYTRQLYIPAISPTTLLIELIFGVLIIAATYTALVGFAHFDLNLGTIVISSELIFATVFAALLFHEYPTGWEIIGGSFIFAAIVASNYHGAGGFLNKYLKR